MTPKERIEKIKLWISEYCSNQYRKPQSLVIGVSGGIDSSVTSTLCAMTGIKTIAVVMPIRQNNAQHELSIQHQSWLEKKFENVEKSNTPLDDVFEKFQEALRGYKNNLGFANSRARLRMTTLYQIAQYSNGIVVGTGNKIEDFGVGFFTKYGDGGVDISPIADCTKTQVWDMGKELGILQSIIDAPPTDGLWDDGRNDKDQMGMSYKQLEEAMKNPKSSNHQKYLELREMNLHKMLPIPTCKMEDN